MGTISTKPFSLTTSLGSLRHSDRAERARDARERALAETRERRAPRRARAGGGGERRPNDTPPGHDHELYIVAERRVSLLTRAGDVSGLRGRICGRGGVPAVGGSQVRRAPVFPCCLPISLARGTAGSFLQDACFYSSWEGPSRRIPISCNTSPFHQHPAPTRSVFFYTPLGNRTERVGPRAE